MAFSTGQLIGVNLADVVPAATATDKVPFKVGTTAIGDDGKLYVFGKASAAIAANTAVCAVNASTFAIAATGGAYLSPATAAANGDWLWVSKAYV